MSGRMIEFDEGNRRFIYRVAGVAVNRGRVLVHTWEGDDPFHILPGGRAELGETGEESVERELREELGCDVRVGRLLWVMDNHFEHRGVRHHALELYFAFDLPQGCLQSSGEPWTGAELDGTKMYFRWQPIDRLHEIDLKPSMLATLLRDLPEHTQYVLHRDANVPGKKRLTQRAQLVARLHARRDEHRVVD